MRHGFMHLSAALVITAMLGLAAVAVPRADAQVTFGAITGTMRAAVFADGVPTCESDPPISGPGPHTVRCGGSGAQVDLTVVVTQFAGPAGGTVIMNAEGTIQVPDFPPPPLLSVMALSAFNIDVAFAVSGSVTVSFGFESVGTVTDAEGFVVAQSPSDIPVQIIGPGSYVLHGNGGAQNSTVPDTFLSNGNFSVDFAVVGFDPPREFSWVGPSGGAYSEPTNWDPQQNAPPVHDGQSGDSVTFGPLPVDDSDPLLDYAVSASGATAERFNIDRASLRLLGAARVFEPSSVLPSLTIIRGGRLILENGARFSGVHGSIGFDPPVQGELSGLELSGATDASFSGRLIFGEFSDGELFLAGGATLSCDQAILGDVAIGSASISGFGSRWDTNALTVGAVSADGSLEVFESGRVEVVGQFVVGERTPGVVRLTNAGKVAAGEVVIGKEAGADGKIELEGDFADEPSALEANGISSFLEVSGALRVGVNGDGLLSITNGASVRAGELHFAPIDLGNAQESRLSARGTDSDDASSSLTVSNPCLLGHGRLEVFDGAQANFADLSLGAGGTTDVNVAGESSAQNPASLITSRLTVGADAFATLKVEAAGQVTCSELAVNSGTGGTGRIVVTEGNVKVNGTMRVNGDALQGDDSVIIEADGQITTNALRLGDQSTLDSAEIVVRNGTQGGAALLVVLNGVFDSNGECSIGLDGPGVLRLENRGFAVASGTARVGGSPAGGTGLVEVGADCRFVTNDLDVGGASAGTIRLLAKSSDLIVTGVAVVNVGGRIEGIGTIDGARIKNPGGFISPGLSPGTLTISGDYEQGEGGTLIIEVAGLNVGQFDVLKVTGNATLAGAVDLRFIDGFVPQPGDSVDFVQIDGTITGKLTGSTIIDAPGDPESGQPAAQAEIKWEVTPVGTCRLTVTDVTALDDAGRLLTPECGTGLCGAGVAPALTLTLAGLLTLRCTRIRKPGRSKP